MDNDVKIFDYMWTKVYLNTINSDYGWKKGFRDYLDNDVKIFDYMWTKVYLNTINSEYGSKNVLMTIRVVMWKYLIIYEQKYIWIT